MLAAIEEAEETGRALLVLHPPLGDDSLEVVRRERFENRRLRHLVEHSADIVFRVDAVGGFRYVSPAAADLLGWSVEELLNRRYVDLVPATSRFEVRRFYFQQLRDRVASTYLEVPVSTSGGNEVWVGQNVQLVIEAGQVMGFEGIAREITDRRRREQQLAHRATHDSLTRLYNRSFFEGQLEKSLAESVRYGTSGAVLVIDLDGFKDVNDRFGHKVGDTYLAGFGELLRRRFRESDVVARLGGDEFAVLLRGPRPDSFEEVAGGLLTMIRLYAATGDERASTTASIGVALYPDHGTSCEHVLAHADLSMYRAKELGRNRFAVFASEESGGAASEEVSAQLLNRVRGALDRRDFELFAQPVYSVNDGTLFFHEILLRLRAADGQILPAASFLDLAERFGSIRDIDFWVLEHVLEHLCGSELPPTSVLGVNLSGRSIGQQEIVELVKDAVLHHRLDASRLIFEITESAAISDLGLAIDFMSALNAMGCRFALDDFGVGFSSLYRLKQLPVELLKIDGNFVRGLALDRADRALVKAIVEVAAALDKETIAEFVEDAATLASLRDAGVDYAQGFFFGKGLPLEEALIPVPRVATPEDSGG